MKKIGLFLREQREKLGLKQKDVAEITGKSSAYLNKVEKGETTPAAGFLQKIAKPLQLEFLDLYIDSLEEKDLPEELMQEMREYKVIRPLLKQGMRLERFRSFTKNLSPMNMERLLLIVESVTLMITSTTTKDSQERDLDITPLHEE